MLIEGEEYRSELSLSANLEGAIFKYCSFKDIALDGKSVDAIFLSCELEKLNWYWGLFNCCLFVDTKFVNCIFQGTNFADCRFLNCEFVNCKFEKDNLHSSCSFERCQWFGGAAIESKGLPEYSTLFLVNKLFSAKTAFF